MSRSEFLGPVAEPNIVHPQKAAFKDVVAETVHFIDPPSEIEKQLVKTLLQVEIVFLAELLLFQLEDFQKRPRLDRRVHIAEFPFIGWDGPVGMLELVEKENPKL